MERIGIYGGTFSPPHNGHLHAAESFLSALSLDKLIVIPTFIPPHKARTETTSPEDRMALCRLAFSDIDKAEISEMEILRQGKSYTSDTLRALTKEGARLYFLCGTDMFLTLASWHEPEVVFALADIVCMARENDEGAREEIERKAEEYRVKFGARIHLLRSEPLEVSSSEIRQKRAEGGAWREKLPATVADYIEEKGLYV